jgi:signal transduction histidine kinase
MAPSELLPHDTGRWDVYDFVCYGTLCAGYLLGVVGAEHLTLGGFLAVTVIHLLWLLLFRILIRYETTSFPVLLALFGVACLGLLEVKLSMGFDWLLPILSVGATSTTLAPRRSALFAGLLLAATIVIETFVDGLPNGFLVQDLTSIIPAFIFVYAFTLLVRHQIAQREHAEQLVRDLETSQTALQTAHTQLQHYADQVEELTITRERNHIAREIHDSLGHYLTILALQLETAAQMEARHDARLTGELAEARHTAMECLAAVRHSVATLRPSGTAIASLMVTLERLVSEFTAVSPQTEVTMDLDGPAQMVPPEARVTLFRAAQEALTNIRKHAGATKVLLRLRVAADHAELAVIDNGQGDSGAVPAPSFGLQGMRERVALLGGTVTAQAVSGQGWRVEVCLPLPLVAPETPAATVQGAPA